MTPRILIAESNGMSPEALAILEGVGEVIVADLDRTALLGALGEVEVLWVRLRNRIDVEVFARAKALRIVASPTTGLDHLDLAAAAAHQVRVISLRDAGAFLKDVRATAELTIGLMLALLRRIPDAVRDVEAGRWDRDAFKGRELHRKVVGIVGFGRLGRLVAGYLRAFEAHVVACDPAVTTGDSVQLLSLTELLDVSDIVTVHVNLTDETRGLIDRDCFARMKPGALLVNTSRGDVIDEAAMLDALQRGHLGGAALDVMSGESSAGVANHPLVRYARDHRELIITPHIGGCTHESMAMTEVFLANRVREALSNSSRG